MLLCSIRIRWVQCALVFLTDSFPTADFDFTGLFNFCTSFFSLYCQACQAAVLIYMPLQQLSHDCMCHIYYSKNFKANKNVKASPPWELLWQTLTSQWFLFYSQCKRAEWAQPCAVSHWCATFHPTLFLGNRCSSALLGASDGPIHKSQLSMSDHSLSCSTIDQHHSGPCPSVTLKNGVLGKWLSKGGVMVIIRNVREETDSGILLQGLKDYVTRMWDEWNSVVLWAFFGVAFLGD